MAIIIKTEEDIQKMRVAGRLAAEVLEMIAPHVVPGVSTGELDRLCHKHIVEQQQTILPALTTMVSLNLFVFLWMMLSVTEFQATIKF